MRRFSFSNKYSFPEDDGFRHEVKYTLMPYEHLRLRDVCAGFMQIDKNAGDNGEYTVKSYYFDTVFFRDYREKLDGINKRQKYRIRTYDDSGYYRLEKKMKVGNRNRKLSGKISTGDADLLLRGRMDIETGNDIADSIINEMRLKGCRSSAYIEYERIAYALREHDIRVTFDKNVRALYGSYSLSDNKPIPIPVFYADEVIMEVKYNEKLPRWFQKAIYRVAPSEFSVSKYAQSLQPILG